ncbi:MAG: cation diffusion facilitator family transporter [Candidatus Hydrothermarchaeales archaeon]
MNHEHEHDSGKAEKELRLVIILTAFILVAEVFGGIISNSLALLSDAAHVFSDLFALSISWFALKLAAKPPSAARTFGYHRAEVFAAVINGSALVIISLFIFKEAYERILTPLPVKSAQMLAIAVIGLIVNLFVVFKLRKHAQTDLNIRSAFFHALGDAIASIGVIIGAVIIMLTGYYAADSIISIFIGVIILAGSFRILKDSTHILLEGTPPHIDMNKVSEAIASIVGVKGVHDLHVWSICSHINAASAHIIVEDVRMKDIDEMSKEIKNKMSSFDISHTTFQFECETCEVTH